MDRPIPQKKRTLKKLLWISLALLGLSAVLLVFFSADDRKELNLERDRLMIAKVQEGEFMEYIPVDGFVQPIRTIFLDAVEGGRIEKRFVEDGALVKEGDPLLQFSNLQLQLDLMNREELLSNERTALQGSIYNKDKALLQLEEQRAELQQSLEKAARIYRQDSALLSGKFVSENEYQAAREEYELLRKKLRLTEEKIRNEQVNGAEQIKQYQASVQIKDKNLDIVRKNVDMLLLRAPASGQLSTFRAEVGEFKMKGQNLGQLDVLDGFKVRAQIDELYVSRVGIGQKAEFTYQGKIYTLLVKTIYPQVQNGRFEADMEFEAGVPAGIKKGQTMQLRLQLGANSRALLLPRGGFYQASGGNWVFVLDKEGRYAVKRNIKTGRQNPQFYELMEGLKVGEEVIISSYDLFKEYDRINIQ